MKLGNIKKKKKSFGQKLGTIQLIKTDLPLFYFVKLESYLIHHLQKRGTHHTSDTQVPLMIIITELNYLCTPALLW